MSAAAAHAESRLHTGASAGAAMKDCRFENIRAFDGAGLLIEDNASVDVSDFIKN